MNRTAKILGWGDPPKLILDENSISVESSILDENQKLSSTPALQHTAAGCASPVKRQFTSAFLSKITSRPYWHCAILRKFFRPTHTVHPQRRPTFNILNRTREYCIYDNNKSKMVATAVLTIFQNGFD